MIFNWLEPKNIHLSMLLETFICLPLGGHPQEHIRLGWKPGKNRVLLSHSITVTVLLRVFISLSHSLRHLFLPFFILLKYSTLSPFLSCDFSFYFQLLTLLCLPLTLFASSITLPSLQVRKGDSQTYIKELFLHL